MEGYSNLSLVKVNVPSSDKSRPSIAPLQNTSYTTKRIAAKNSNLIGSKKATALSVGPSLSKSK
jgi:hypothetical protein